MSISMFLTCFLAAGAAGDTAAAREPASLAWAPSPRTVGSVSAPAVLPAGSMSVFGQIGAPEVGAGYRQGFESFELEARALFHYLELSALVEAGVRTAVWRSERAVVAPGLSLGLRMNSGSRYYDTSNFGSFALRPRFSLNTSFSLGDTVQGLVMFEVPWALSLNVIGTQVTPLLGLGAEFHLGGDLSLLVSAHGGVDAIKEPLGVTQVRPAWALRLALGYRVF
jgi:hypothetical protein